ncbi:hypothetical protein TYRP_018002 [Tyrophagus putrescentiae]|nr:hypothetical protein TYRP_018002 [Tyrophagus putrescentiae]
MFKLTATFFLAALVVVNAHPRDVTTLAPLVTEVVSEVFTVPDYVTGGFSTEVPAPSSEAPSTYAPAPSSEAPAPSSEAPAPSSEAPAPSTYAPAPSTELLISSSSTAYDGSVEDVQSYYFCSEREPLYFLNMTIADEPVASAKVANLDRSESQVVLRLITDLDNSAPLLPIN